MSRDHRQRDGMRSRSCKSPEQLADAYRNLVLEYKRQTTELQEIKLAYANAIKHLKDVEEELTHCRRSADVRQVELEKLKLDLHTQTRRAERREMEHAAMAELLKIRTAELESAIAFMPPADSVTDMCILELVQDLNYEIVQAAAALVEAYDTPQLRQDLVEAYEDTQRHPPSLETVTSGVPVPLWNLAGNRIIAVLQMDHPQLTDRSTIVQLGLQACFTSLAQFAVCEWSFCTPTAFNSVFERMRNDGKNCDRGPNQQTLTRRRLESQEVAVKWSSLSHKYARLALDKGFSKSNIVETFASYAAEAVMFAGYDCDIDFQERVATILSRSRQQLEDIANLILQLNEALGQKISSGWMECWVAPQNGIFKPGEMDIAYGEHRRSSEGKRGERPRLVVCTTALGLRKISGRLCTLLLKPRVVLENVLSEET
ncbi:hypothetical protein K488DRAFT_71653 [Vararia minispora EC-137]|uniref:Uncharacterized protein n=1 Tax=Vararia minispora EC-137 TaxID=1314806 RepID=A0ACB8QH16_9AGAM|nr:hypothetical protein K488DRAFT_71653 [Vararia minispora EC-137]